jgi:uncharacterized protein (TIGR03437 family)
MHRASALAANSDGSLNFPDQPAAPGSVISIYATGLRSGHPVIARFDGRAITATSQDVPQLTGIAIVRWQLPATDELVDGILHTIEIDVDGVASNQATVSVDRHWRPRSSLPVEVGIQTIFE